MLVAFHQHLVMHSKELKNFISFTASKVLPVLQWLGDKISNITLKEVGIVAIGVGLIVLSKNTP